MTDYYIALACIAVGIVVLAIIQHLGGPDE